MTDLPFYGRDSEERCGDSGQPLMFAEPGSLGTQGLVEPEAFLRVPLLGFTDAGVPAPGQPLRPLINPQGSSRGAEVSTLQFQVGIHNPGDWSEAPATEADAHLVALITGGVGNNSLQVYCDVRQGTQLAMGLASVQVAVGYMARPTGLVAATDVGVQVAAGQRVGPAPTMSTDVRVLPVGPSNALVQVPPLAHSWRVLAPAAELATLSGRQLGSLTEPAAVSVGGTPGAAAAFSEGMALWGGAAAVIVERVGGAAPVNIVVEFTLAA